MPIHALTISGAIAGEHPIIVQDHGNGTVKVYQGSVSIGLTKEAVDAYQSDYTGLVDFLKSLLHGDEEVPESDKDRADRLEAALQRIANEGRDHFCTSIAMEALQGWDARR